MNLLDSITDRYPVLSVFTGTSASMTSWFLANLDTLTGVARFLIAFFGVLTGIFTLLIVARHWYRGRLERKRDRYFVRRRAEEIDNDDYLP